MPPSQKITKANYFSKDFTLPPIHLSHDVMKFKLFECSLLPEMPEDKKRIVMQCTSCTKRYFFGLTRNWTTLKDHYETTHYLTMERIQREADNSPTPNEWTILGSSLLGSSGVYRGSYTIDELMHTDDPESSISRKMRPGTRKGPTHLPLDKNEYERLMLMMIVKNDLPFSLVESPSFRDLIHFLRDDAPSLSRSTLRRRLEDIYELEFKRVKKKLDGNTGKFSITLDEWKSGNNIDFLGITLHFYNNDFELENYTIGFEELNGKSRYTGMVLYEFLMEVLKKYGIEERILAITRDNAAPNNVMMQKFTEELSIHGTEFHGDIRCAGHIMNLTTNAFLSYTFFKANDTQKFQSSMETLLESNPSFKDTAGRMKQLPRIMRLILVQMNFNHKSRNSFQKLVETKKGREGTKKGPEKLLRDNDTRWLSVYRMIDRFIYFKTEIMSVLRMCNGSFLEETADLEKFQLATKDWDYLKVLHKILQIFREPTARLQASSYPTINQTIPMVWGVLSSLKELGAKYDSSENPLIAFGSEEARNKLLEYYPLDDEMNKSNKMLFLAIVLDPRYKMEVFQYVGFSDEKILSIKSDFIEVFHEYQKQFKDASDVNIFENDAVSPEMFSPRGNQTIPMVWGVLSSLKELGAKYDSSENPLIAFGSEEARNKLLEYYPLDDEMNKSNKMLFLAIVLDPRYKMEVFQYVGFSDEKILSIKSDFIEVFHEYQKQFKDASDVNIFENDAVSPEMFSPRGFHFVKEKREVMTSLIDILRKRASPRRRIS